MVHKFSKYGGVFQSGQMGQTVNLLSLDFGGSNPSAPTLNAEVFREANESSLLQFGDAKTPAKIPQRNFCGNSSVDRALAFQAGGRGFESRFPLN